MRSEFGIGQSQRVCLDSEGRIPLDSNKKQYYHKNGVGVALLKRTISTCPLVCALSDVAKTQLSVITDSGGIFYSLDSGISRREL